MNEKKTHHDYTKLQLRILWSVDRSIVLELIQQELLLFDLTRRSDSRSVIPKGKAVQQLDKKVYETFLTSCLHRQV
jgi:hypothetical protein